MAYNECDTNADTCCLGKNFVITGFTTQTADVYPYDKSYAPMQNVPIVTGATAYDDPVTGQTYILLFHEALYDGTKLDHSLINPSQCRHSGIPFWDNPYDADRPMGVHPNPEVFIPLDSSGTKVQFRTRSPTQNELEQCFTIDMTSPIPWEPVDITLGKVHSTPGLRAPLDIESERGEYDGDTTHHRYSEFETDDAMLHEIEPSLIHLKERLISKIQVRPQAKVTVSATETATDDVPLRRTFVSTERHQKLTADQLSETWCIGPRRAKETLKATTQRGVRSAILPLSRRYRADRMFSTRKVLGKYATDTLWATTKSLAGHVASQVYTHKSGFAASYHIRAATGDEIGHSLTDFLHD